ncbi:NAD-dependent epimerase/dehydratase family protein [Sphingomonas lacunae]|nr:NAD-dependent epimerase/dehydratase family protein [Sphingomonas lacunae]
MATSLSPSLAGCRVWVAGHAGMLGQALLRALEQSGATALTASRAQLDLRDRDAVAAWLGQERPDMAVIAAARVGGVAAYEAAPLDYLADNALIALSVTAAAAAVRLPRLCFVASAAAYPEHAAQPLQESALMSGPLDAAHRTYGLAKLLGIEAVASARRQHGLDWFSVLPTNLYGRGGKDDAQNGHVLATLVRRALAAKADGDAEMLVWGTGAARRDFLHVDDCARAIVLLLGASHGHDVVNIGSGADVSIADLAAIISSAADYEGELRFDPSKPEGAARRMMDIGRLRALGWWPTISLRRGIAAMVEGARVAKNVNGDMGAK